MNRETLKKKISEQLYKMSIRLRILVLPIILGALVLLLSGSYALWVQNNTVGKITIKAGEFTYKLTSTNPSIDTEFSSNPSVNIILNANERKTIDITVTGNSTNAISSDIEMYYKSTDVKVFAEFLKDTEKPKGTFDKNTTTKTYTIILTNSSLSQNTITIGLIGGLKTKTFLSEGQYTINSSTIFEQEFVYTGSQQEFIAPLSGYYNIELWGGSMVTSLGAYTKGNIYLEKNEKIYVYVGSTTISCNPYSLCGESFNGGGAGGWWTATNYPVRGFGGGGATDVRLTSGAWNDSNGLKNRIMVAAGAGSHGAGGGLLGTSASSALYGYPGGGGATQTSGGTSSYDIGKFGIGGNGYIDSHTIANCNDAYGGGGGYYGGGGGRAGSYTDCVHDTIGRSGGGSSFISGYSGVNAITSNQVHTNNTIHFSGKYFLDGKMTEGVNNGNGKAKISYVNRSYPKNNEKLNKVRYIKDCTTGNNLNGYSHWVELQAIQNGINLALNKLAVATSKELSSNYLFKYITDGIATDLNVGIPESMGLQCITIDLKAEFDLDEIAVWHYKEDKRIFSNNTLSVGKTNKSGTEFLDTILIDNDSTTPEDVDGKRFNAWQ